MGECADRLWVNPMVCKPTGKSVHGHLRQCGVSMGSDKIGCPHTLEMCCISNPCCSHVPSCCTLSCLVLNPDMSVIVVWL